MRSWTRTLNLDDAHVLLGLATPGTPELVWKQSCHAALSHLSTARCRELIRILREDFLALERGRIGRSLFLEHYVPAPPPARIELVAAQWALTHPLSLDAVDRLIRPALEAGDPQIHLADFTDFVGSRVETASQASLVKTRTVLVRALEGVGCLGTQGTGRHRTLWAKRGTPLAATVTFLEARGGPTLPSRLTACGVRLPETAPQPG